MNHEIIMLTLSMAAVTYLGRVMGYWFIKLVKPGPKTEQFLNLVPGTIFIAMITPQVISGGLNLWLAGGLVFITTVLTRNLFIALILGVGVFITLISSL